MSSGAERTEQATPHKRQESRKKGQVAKSMEVNAALGLLSAYLALKWFGAGLVSSWRTFAQGHLAEIGRYEELTPGVLQGVLGRAEMGYFVMLLPMLLFMMTIGLLANVMQTGLMFSTQSLVFDFKRLNPIQGFTRMFSSRSAMDLLKATAKALVLGYIIYSFFRDRGPEMTRLGWDDFSLLGLTIQSLCLDLLLKATMAVIVIAGIDYMFQRWQFEKSIRMSKQEVKEEYKKLEGDPQVKGQVRQRQREMTRNRMMAEVPSATVVITNPTHLAIALRYDPSEMAAPQVIAKGQRLIAQHIKEVARAHGIPTVENKPLARALFKACNVGDVIPLELYETVAEIIAFVYRQSGRGPVGRPAPGA